MTFLVLEVKGHPGSPWQDSRKVMSGFTQKKRDFVLFYWNSACCKWSLILQFLIILLFQNANWKKDTIMFFSKQLQSKHSSQKYRIFTSWKRHIFHFWPSGYFSCAGRSTLWQSQKCRTEWSHVWDCQGSASWLIANVLNLQACIQLTLVITNTY